MHDEKNNWYQKHYNVKRTIILKQNSRKLWNFATFTGDCFLKGEEQKQNFAQQKKRKRGEKIAKRRNGKECPPPVSGLRWPSDATSNFVRHSQKLHPCRVWSKERKRKREREKEREKGTRFSFSFSTVVFVYQEFYRL